MKGWLLFFLLKCKCLELFLLFCPAGWTWDGFTTFTKGFADVRSLPFCISNFVFVLSRMNKSFSEDSMKLTASETSDFEKVFKTSRKLAAARNFFAVALTRCVKGEGGFDTSTWHT